MIKKNFLKVLNYHSLLRSPQGLLIAVIIVVVLFFFFLGCNTPVLASLGIHSKTSFSDNPSVNLVVLRKVSYVLLVPDLDSDFGIHRWFLKVPLRVTQVASGFEIKSNLFLFGFKISE